MKTIHFSLTEESEYCKSCTGCGYTYFPDPNPYRQKLIKLRCRNCGGTGFSDRNES